jgi:hypothetical protein
MSNTRKAQTTPKFNWYTCWTLLCADGMPDKLIKEGLKQPNDIKIIFKRAQKDHTRHVVPDQAQFRPKYFLPFTPPDFKSKIVTPLSKTKKEDSPTLYSLMGQCFQDVGLTELTNIVGKQCPNNMHLTKKTFDQCKWNYLEEVARFLNIGNQLIHWLCISKMPAFMPTH